MKIGPNNFLGINWEPLPGDSTEYQLWYGDEHNASSRTVRDLDQRLNKWLYEKKPKTDFRGPLSTLQQMAAARRRSDHRKVLRELSHQLNAGLPPLSPATRELGESILKQFPADKGWKLETQKTVTDFTRYASLIPVVATNTITKETHIIDIDSAGTQKNMFTKAKLSAQRRMLEMTQPGTHVTGTWSASINPQARISKMTPMEDSGLNKALYGMPFGGGFRNLDKEDHAKMAPLDTSILKRYPLYKGPYARSFSYLDTETGYGREILSVGAINIALDKDGKVLGRLDNGFFRFYPSRNEKTAGFRMAAQVNNLSNKLINGYRKQQGAKYSKYWNKKELNALNKYLEGQVVFGHNVDSYDREVLRVGELRPQAKGWFDTYTFMQNNSLSYKGARDLDSWYKLTTGRSMEKGGWEHHQVQADVGAGAESTAALLADTGRLGKQARLVTDSERALSLAGVDSNLNSWVVDTNTGEYIDMSEFNQPLGSSARFTRGRGSNKSWFDADGTIFKTYDPTIQYELGNGKTGPVFAAFDAGITTPFETTASMINEDMVKRILDEKKAGTFGGILTTALGAKLRDGSMIPGETDDTLLAKTIKAKEAQRRALNRALRDYARGKPEYKGVIANISPDEWHVLKSGTNKFEAAVSFGGKKGDILYDDSKREGEPWVAASGDGTWNQVVIPDSVAKAAYGGRAPSPGNPSTQRVVPEIATVNDEGVKSMAEGFHIEEGDLQARADQMSDAELMADATRELFSQGIGDMKSIIQTMAKAREDNVADFTSMRRADALKAVERTVNLGLDEGQARDFLSERYLHGPDDPFINDLIRYRRGYEQAYAIRQKEVLNDQEHKAYLAEREAERRELEDQQDKAAGVSRDIGASSKLSDAQKKDLQARADVIVGSSEFAASLHGVRDAFKEAEDQADRFQKALSKMLSPVTDAKWYNGEQIASTAQSNLGRWEAASKGFVPGILQRPLHFLNAAHKDMWQNWWDQNYALRYKGLNVAQGVISNAAGAVGHVVGGTSGELLAKSIVGLPATISQIAGNVAQNRMQVFGNQMSQALNLLSAGVQTALIPLKLFGMLLGVGAVSFKKFMNSLSNFGMPLTGLSGVNYPSYEGHGMMDILAGMKPGSLNAAAESFGYQSSSLFTMGQFDQKRLISSALLGTFDTTYNTEMSGEEMLAASYNSIMPRYLAADKRTQQNMMAWMKNVDPALAQMVQAGANLGIMDYDTYKDPGRRGIYFRNVSQGERNAFQWDNYEWQGSLRQLDFTKARVAHNIWNTFGRDTMNGVNRSLDAFSQGDYTGGINGLVDTFRTLWERLSRIISGSDLPTALSDALKGAFEGAIKWLGGLDWSQLGVRIGSIVDIVGAKIADLLTLLGTIRIDPTDLNNPIKIGASGYRGTDFLNVEDFSLGRITHTGSENESERAQIEYKNGQIAKAEAELKEMARSGAFRNMDKNGTGWNAVLGVLDKYGLGEDAAIQAGFGDFWYGDTLRSIISQFSGKDYKNGSAMNMNFMAAGLKYRRSDGFGEQAFELGKNIISSARETARDAAMMLGGGAIVSQAHKGSVDINIRDQNGKNITTISTENGIVTNITEKKFDIGNMVYQIESKGGI